MDLFQKATTVKLSHKDKYLVAEDDQESVSLARDGLSKNAIWSVQFFETERYLRFKSCYGKYLTTSDAHLLHGLNGRKVVQSIPKKFDSSTQWERIRDGFLVRFQTLHGNFLRPNGGLPPWRNSVTDDVPHQTGTGENVLWDVKVVEATPKMPPLSSSPSPVICRESMLIVSFPVARTPPTVTPQIREHDRPCTMKQSWLEMRLTLGVEMAYHFDGEMVYVEMGLTLGVEMRLTLGLEMV
ncbi:hypothetical protein RHGRI_028409 [Rhododendron griersonianum]|uniref:DUF569 domain-containing protein n=1 Tax=Rhododendron griersonianum TaxID=479676 RepID=A0AAV6IFW6_9ERIC|nr:hypothetical protein RHGRI_028409 [Rhododendron griersonianum]